MSHEGPSRQARDRGATRSKAEKVRPPTQPVPQVDIVPGRLSEAEWIAFSALEEGEDVVGDILADLLARVMECAFTVYLTQQCIPFTISQAREAMLQITEWRFLARDEGESAVAEDPTWGEDEEPLACATDAWAQGSVPVLHAPSPDVVEEHIPSEDPGNSDQFFAESPWPESQERTESSQPSAEQRVSPVTQLTLEVFPEAQPGDPLAQSNLQAGSGGPEESTMEALRPPPELARAASPQPSTEPASLVSAQATAEKVPPPSAHPLIKDLYLFVPLPDGAGDRPKRKAPGPARASASESLSSALATTELSLSHQPDGADPSRGRKPTMVRLDPARLPRHWVRPVAEVLVSDHEPRTLETYRGRPRAEKMLAGVPTPVPGSPVRSRADRGFYAPALGYPSQPCSLFRALGPDPTLNLGQSSTTFGSKLPFRSPGFRFLAMHPKPSEVVGSTSPKLWPRVRWPSGWEQEAEQEAEVVLPAKDQGIGIEDSGWPLALPQVLEPTSRVPWKPMVPSETMKLAPGVSMWNRGTQELLNSAATQKDAEGGGTSQAAEQQPIQTGVSKPQVITTQVIKKETPKA